MVVRSHEKVRRGYFFVNDNAAWNIFATRLHRLRLLNLDKQSNGPV